LASIFCPLPVGLSGLVNIPKISWLFDFLNSSKSGVANNEDEAINTFNALNT
jgi:hypothetical protein